MKLRNRDINVEPIVRKLKRAAVGKVNSLMPKRKKVEDPETESESKFDYDATMVKNPYAVANFAPDIFKYMKDREPIYQLPSSLKANIKEVDRASIVNWIIDRQEERSFTHETLYIAIRLFDIYLAGSPSMSVKMHKLVAGSSFLIASKFEEYRPISIASLEKLCGKKYTADDFKIMEREILKMARYDLGFPLAYSFLRRFSRVIGGDMKVLTLARLYLEIATHYSEWSLELPSKVAAACLTLAFDKIGFESDWATILEQYSAYSITELKEFSQDLNESMNDFKKTFPKCKAVIEKYSTEAFFGVADEFLA
jgi:hypothetical protein